MAALNTPAPTIVAHVHSPTRPCRAPAMAAISTPSSESAAATAPATISQGSTVLSSVGAVIFSSAALTRTMLSTNQSAIFRPFERPIAHSGQLSQRSSAAGVRVGAAGGVCRITPTS